MSNEFACRRPDCETLCRSSSEPVTVAGWYGNVRFAWDAGRLVAVEAACDAHRPTADEEVAASDANEAGYAVSCIEDELAQTPADEQLVRRGLERDLDRARDRSRAADAKLRSIRGW